MAYRRTSRKSRLLCWRRRIVNLPCGPSLTATGSVYGCLGQDQKIELRDLLRAGQSLDAALDALMLAKPKGHDFHIAALRPAVARHMSVTGG